MHLPGPHRDNWVPRAGRWELAVLSARGEGSLSEEPLNTIRSPDSLLLTTTVSDKVPFPPALHWYVVPLTPAQVWDPPSLFHLAGRMVNVGLS